MKASDYIAKFLVDNGIGDLFLISGGGMMHMLDSVSQEPRLNLVFNLNEQASAICAESYGQFTGNLGACMVTTGPGSTNAVTGCAGAWVDGTPVLYLSGQCRTQQMGQLRGLRIYGAQEIAIVPVVTPITKYAKTILNASELRYHLEKAVYLATHGRKGPVWIDVPLDVQGAQMFPPRRWQNSMTSSTNPGGLSLSLAMGLLRHTSRRLFESCRKQCGSRFWLPGAQRASLETRSRCLWAAPAFPQLDFQTTCYRMQILC
jgi:thiamine pyrophosphate-dependent acetolactate synthase large subunit-like protein